VTEPLPGRPTVVFDLGGVLVDWDPRYLYRKLMPEEDVDEFLAEIGFTEWNHAQDSGGPWDEAVASLATAYPHRRELIAAYPARFLETLGGPIHDVVTILDELAERGTRLLALTNWSAQTFATARAVLTFLDRFEGVVVSGEEGLAKPDPRLFERLAGRYSLLPSHTVYVDDAAANVAAASALGFDAVHFRGATGLRADLAGRGLLPPVD
jgi:2-haloacid dehalogenase